MGDMNSAREPIWLAIPPEGRGTTRTVRLGLRAARRTARAAGGAGSGRSAGARRAPRRRPAPGPGGPATRAASRSAVRAGRRRALSSGASREAARSAASAAVGRQQQRGEVVVGDDEAARAIRPVGGEPVRGGGAAQARGGLGPGDGRAAADDRPARRRARRRSGAGARARRGRARSTQASPAAAPPTASTPIRRASRVAVASMISSPGTTAPLAASPRPGLPRRPASRPPPAPRRASAATSRRPGRRCGSPPGAGGGSWDEQADQPPPAALALAGGRRLLLGVAVGRLRGDLVDVGEHRLAEREQRVGRQPRVLAGLDEAAPGEPGADPVGGEQRVEAAAGVELAAPEVHVRVARAADVGGRVGDHVHEAPERDLDAEPHHLPERPFHRARVVGDLDGDRGDHLVGEAGQRRVGAPRPPRAAQPRRWCGPQASPFVARLQETASQPCANGERPACAAGRTQA